MGYPVYKLLRAVNRQYPNNGFINYVDVTEDLTNGIIDEDLRDLINETLQEVYINIAVDETYSFPTVPGQREYVLPEDCDLRDIQEVTRTFASGVIYPPPPSAEPPLPTMYTVTFYANGGTGTMEPMEAEFGTEVTLPPCTFTPPTGEDFVCYMIGEEVYHPGDTYVVNSYTTVTATWENQTYVITFMINSGETRFSDDDAQKEYNAVGGLKVQASIPSLPEVFAVAENAVFDGWLFDDTVYTENEILNMTVPSDLTLTAHVSEVGSWRLVLIRASDGAGGDMTVKTKVYGAAETEQLLNQGGHLDFLGPKGETLEGRYEYIKAYITRTGVPDLRYLGPTLVYTVDLTTVLTENTEVTIPSYGVTFVAGSNGVIENTNHEVISSFTKVLYGNEQIGAQFTETELNAMPVPDAGYEFRGWLLDNAQYDTDNLLDVAVTRPLHIRAVFEREGE